ncbi:uncharacterized protein LOC129724934 [Wyeomyia smithii]|uniref:uncharacterized protein LOC129724934 n=1 Tax=Wyeomyia smithii TaxID=174621 RepID=UPI002467EFFB|nr:uncharacterized protein LOC129724934 [Wyeomyia smithii]
MGGKVTDCSLLDCLLSPRLYGVLVGLMSLWAMFASISASFYLLMKYDDIRKVPDSLQTYYHYALVDVIIVQIGIAIVGFYLFGIYKADERYLIPFLALLVVDFLAYIVSEALIYADYRGKRNLFQLRWKKNAFDTAVFICVLTIVVTLYRSFKRERHHKDSRLGGYQSIPDTAENFAMDGEFGEN